MLVLLLWLSSCKKNRLCDFPYVYENITLGIPSDLGNVGPGKIYLIPAQGLNKNGILVYKSETPDDYGNFKFSAFDRTCTHEPDYSCSIDTISGFNGIVECPCCKSKFLLMFEGDVFNGPAICPLIRYSCITNGDILYIRNQ
jgi:Rieske Fe-S protein